MGDYSKSNCRRPLKSLRAPAVEHEKRGDVLKKADSPAAYFYGTEFGQQEAAERLEALMQVHGWTF
jgi:hypothetical protein